MALYSDVGNYPYQKLVETQFQQNPGGRNEVAVPTLALPAGTYWIAIQFLQIDGYVKWQMTPNVPRTATTWPDPDVMQPLPQTFQTGSTVHTDQGAVNLYLIGLP
jgi:hypothetical protein